MRPVNQLVHSRTRVEKRYALMPLEGYPFSRIPSWGDAQVRVLASPALGAEFVQYLIDLPAGKTGAFLADDQVETFYFVLVGKGAYSDSKNTVVDIEPGSYGLTPPGKTNQFTASENLQLLILQKKYQASPGIDIFDSMHNHESRVKKEIWAENPHSLLQTLIPDAFAYDMAMNIFTFDPGYGLPIVETHVMEHGLVFLQGKGVYYLDGTWMEVEKDDFIWMGPYCPQSFYATGPVSSKYIYYKNVNREILI